ncbi:hypothetical protein JCM11251_006737 [Rhodosporidiobolus azoricus]
MPASSARKGRKLNRQPTNGSRTPACKSCQKRRVRCDGGDPCQSCVRKAAWDGVPPPTPGPGGGCEYEGGRAPCPRTAFAKPQKTRAGRRVEDDAEEEDEDDSEGDDDESSRSRSRKGKGRAREGGGCGAGGGGSKPLQKGLACLACKSRRVRCDGLKPACTACVKLAEKHGGVECIYRADLYLQKQREEQERMTGFKVEVSVKEEEVEEDEYMGVPTPSATSPTFVKQEYPVQPFSLLNPDLLPPLPPLPATHHLPSLPAVPAPQHQQFAAPSLPLPSYSEQLPFPPAPATDACCAAPSALCLSSIFPSLPYPYTASTSAAAGLASQPSTAPPSPTYSAYTPSLASVSTYHGLASSSAWSTSSASAFPSPRTPLEDWTFRLRPHGGQPTYPPVPYPAPKEEDFGMNATLAGVEKGGMDGAGDVRGAGGVASVNPFWTTTNAIPPLMLGSDPEEFSLSFASSGGSMTAEGFHPSSSSSPTTTTSAIKPRQRPVPTMEIKRSPPRMFDDELLTLTLPMIPEFETRDWN